ncbi:MAG TPA: hypothetical protein VIQ31_17870, partial [Phormidium sp.]
QVLARFQPLFPKAKRIKITKGEFKNQIALVGIAFSGGGGGGDGKDKPTPPDNPTGLPGKPVVSKIETLEQLPIEALSDLGKGSKAVLLSDENLAEKIDHVPESNVEDQDREVEEGKKLAFQHDQSSHNVEVVTDSGDVTVLQDASLDAEVALPMEQITLPTEQDINDVVQGLRIQSKRPWPSAKLPEIGDRVNTNDGQGKVMEIGTDQNYEIYFEVLIDGSTKLIRYLENQLSVVG